MAAEGSEGSALLAKGHVEVTVVTKKGEDGTKKIFDDIGKQADVTGAKVSDSLSQGVVGGLQIAGKKAPAEAAKVGAAAGKATTDGVVKSLDGAAVQTGIVGMLSSPRAVAAGDRLGTAIGKALSVPIAAASAVAELFVREHADGLDKLNGKYNALGAQVAAAKAHLDNLNASSKEAAKYAAGSVHLPGTAVPVGAAPSEILAASTALEVLNKRQNEVGESIKGLLASTGAVAGAEGVGLAKGLDGIASKAEETGAALTGVKLAGGETAEAVGGIGAALAGLLADPVVLIGAAFLATVASGGLLLKTLYDIGDQWEEIGNAIAVQTGASGEALEGLTKDTRDIAGKIALPIDQIGHDLGTVKQQFGDLNDTDLKEVTTQVGQLQQMIGNFNIKNVGDSFRAFGVEGAKDQTTALNELFHAYQETGVGVDEMARNVAAAQPTASQFGLTFDQTAGYLTSFEHAGLDSSKALLTLSAAQKSLEKGVAANPKKGILGIDPIKDPADLNKGLMSVLTNIKQLQDAGDKAGAKDLAEQLFGKSTGRGGGPADNILAVLSKGMDPSNLVASLNTVTDSISGMYAQTTTIGSAWQETKNSMLAALAPMSEGIHGFVTTGLEGVSGWIKAHSSEIIEFFGTMARVAIIAIQGITRELGVFVSDLGNVVGAVGKVVGAMDKFQAWQADIRGDHEEADQLRAQAEGAYAWGNSLKDAGQKMQDFANGSMSDYIDKLHATADAAASAAKIHDALGDSLDKLKVEGENVTIDVADNTPEIEEKLRALGIHLHTIADDPTKLQLTADTDPAKTIIDNFRKQQEETDTKLPVDADTTKADNTIANWFASKTQNPLVVPLQVSGAAPAGSPPAPASANSSPLLPGSALPFPFGTGHALGGAIYGMGRKGKDSVPSILAPGEHVWTDTEVDAVGGQRNMYHLRAMARAGMLKPFAGGGDVAFNPVNTPFAPMTGLSGGDHSKGNFNPGIAIDTSNATATRAYGKSIDPDQLARLVAYRRTFPAGGTGYSDDFDGDQKIFAGYAKGGAVGDESGVSGFAGMRYGMGLFGNGGFDCSGAVSAGVNTLSGRAWNQGPPNGSARMNTHNEGSWLTSQGWKLGVGPSGYAQVGWTTKGAGGGHTAMTFPDGTNFESSSDKGVTLGGKARGALDSLFDQHAWMPLGPEADGAGGGGASGGGSSSGGAASSAQLSAAGDAVSKATNSQSVAQQKLDADKAAGASADQLAKDQDGLAKATKQLTDSQQKLSDLQAKGTDPKSQKNPLTDLAGIGGNALKENLPPGFSDPTSWPVMKSLAGALKFGAGFVKDPVGNGLLNAGASALGGDAGGAATSLVGLLPKPFGQVTIGSPGDTPGFDAAPTAAGTQSGSSFDPSALLPMPNVAGNGSGPPPGPTAATADSHDINQTYHGQVDRATHDKGQSAASKLHRQVTNP